MKVDLEETLSMASKLREAGWAGPASRLESCVGRIRELLSAHAEVRSSKTHREAVEAAQRALSGEPPEHIWTQEELDAK